MNDHRKNDKTIPNLAACLSTRYGPLALTRAAGAAAAATRKGDTAAQTLWRQVVDHLRRAMPVCQTA